MRKKIRLKDITGRTYTKFDGKYSKTSIKLLTFKIKTEEISWKELRDSLSKGYRPKKHGYISICRFFGKNYALNGNHRLALLKTMRPDNFMIEVESYNLLHTLALILMIIMVVAVSFTIWIVNNLIKIVNNYVVQIFRIKRK